MIFQAIGCHAGCDGVIDNVMLKKMSGFLLGCVTPCLFIDGVGLTFDFRRFGLADRRDGFTTGSNRESGGRQNCKKDSF
ncbi:MAG TPA: hypothetical protein VLL08_02080 [Kineosporiaceae bacterium]|nr:hypothetical protein [Kineosporiaceae bacterium]